MKEPFCYILYGYPRPYSQPSPKGLKGEKTKENKEWKPKENVTSLIAHTSLRVFSREDWYFNSGCSWNMSGEKSYLKNLSHTQIVMIPLGMKQEEKSMS